MFSAFDNAPRAVVALDPVALAHVFNTYFGASARGVQEAVVAQIDADVREGSTHGIEEDKITGLEFVFVNFVADLALLLSCARQKHADRVLENELNKTAAIESTVGISSSAAIVDSDEFQTFKDQVFGVARITFEQGGLIGGFLRLFDRLRSAYAGEGDCGGAEQVCDEFVRRHGVAI